MRESSVQPKMIHSEPISAVLQTLPGKVLSLREPSFDIAVNEVHDLLLALVGRDNPAYRLLIQGGLKEIGGNRACGRHNAGF